MSRTTGTLRVYLFGHAWEKGGEVAVADAAARGLDVNKLTRLFWATRLLTQ